MPHVTQVVKRLTRPVVEEKVALEMMTKEQEEAALQLMTDNPIMWNSSSISELFNVSLDSVNDLKVGFYSLFTSCL